MRQLPYLEHWNLLKHHQISLFAKLNVEWNYIRYKFWKFGNFERTEINLDLFCMIKRWSTGKVSAGKFLFFFLLDFYFWSFYKYAFHEWSTAFRRIFLFDENLLISGCIKIFIKTLVKIYNYAVQATNGYKLD